jgi:hypothetical protein
MGYRVSMKPPQSEASPSPSVHSRNIQRELTQLIEHLEADTKRVDDRRFRALLEKSSEVLKGLRTLFERFGPSTAAVPEGKALAKNAKNGSEPASPTTTGKGSASAKPLSAKSPQGTKGNALAPVAKTGSVKTARETTASTKRDRPSLKSGNTTMTSDVPNAGRAAKPLPTAPAKPQDPDDIAAKARLQRQAARAPRMPGHSAPKPTPAQSGKPIWDKPHSS